MGLLKNPIQLNVVMQDPVYFSLLLKNPWMRFQKINRFSI